MFAWVWSCGSYELIVAVLLSLRDAFVAAVAQAAGVDGLETVASQPVWEVLYAQAP